MSEFLKPTETRESVNFDKEADVASFDYFIDEWQSGRLSYVDAIQAYIEVRMDKLAQDEQNG